MAQRPVPSYWVYRDSQRLWRWRYDGVNGRPIAVSSESYNNKADCMRAVEIMQASRDSEIWSPNEDMNAL